MLCRILPGMSMPSHLGIVTAVNSLPVTNQCKSHFLSSEVVENVDKGVWRG